MLSRVGKFVLAAAAAAAGLLCRAQQYSNAVHNMRGYVSVVIIPYV